MTNVRLFKIICPFFIAVILSVNSYPDNMKKSSVFFPDRNMADIFRKSSRNEWSKDTLKNITVSALPWMQMSDEELWELMFGPTLQRSVFVWSDGFCPKCKFKDPAMWGAWKADPLKTPWKVTCANCGETFPKNDFYAFYKSGLDNNGIFDYKLADRSLLYNTEHPDSGDPLHLYGVDDGTGYCDGEKRWKFIAYYLTRHFAACVYEGIVNCANAYTATGEPVYAHKALIMLDRLADMWPDFDFATQGDMYEGKIGPSQGYVTYWYFENYNIQGLAMAYDQVFGELKNDTNLISFLNRQAIRHNLAQKKNTPEDIQANIENRILRDAINNKSKIGSNFPRTDYALITLKAVLGWPDNRNEIMCDFDRILKTGTAVDGLTGERGLPHYSAMIVEDLPAFLGKFSKIDDTFLPDILKRHPDLYKTYRFHIDLWAPGEYYPMVGDGGAFGQKIPFIPRGFPKNNGFIASYYSFYWQLYKATKDTDFLKVMYIKNNNSSKDLPYDIFEKNPEIIQNTVMESIKMEGSSFAQKSTNKEDWCIAMMRSGKGKNERAFWIHYSVGGPHQHYDGLNMGLYAKGLDLMPENGYPPLMHGGWYSPEALWYRMTAAHNTVTVDCKSQRAVPDRQTPTQYKGQTTLWADGSAINAIRVSAPDFMVPEIENRRYERTVAMIDISEKDSYILDIFRVSGGCDHAKFFHSTFGLIATNGLDTQPSGDYGNGTFMRNFKGENNATPGWSADWKIDDFYGYNETSGPKNVGLKYTDLTIGAEARTAEGWISSSTWGTSYKLNKDVWIPCLMVRKQSESADLNSTFVSIIEPYEKESSVKSLKRLPLKMSAGIKCPESFVCVETFLKDGRKDILVAADADNYIETGLKKGRSLIIQKQNKLKTDGELCVVRTGKDGKISYVSLCKGSVLNFGKFSLKLNRPCDLLEIEIIGEHYRILTGDISDINEIKIKRIALSPLCS